MSNFDSRLDKLEQRFITKPPLRFIVYETAEEKAAQMRLKGISQAELDDILCIHVVRESRGLFGLLGGSDV